MIEAIVVVIIALVVSPVDTRRMLAYATAVAAVSWPMTWVIVHRLFESRRPVCGLIKLWWMELGRTISGQINMRWAKVLQIDVRRRVEGPADIFWSSRGLKLRSMSAAILPDERFLVGKQSFGCCALLTDLSQALVAVLLLVLLSALRA